MSQLIVDVLGSGPASARPHRKNSSYLVTRDSGMILVDCSGSPVHEILRLGKDPSSLECVVLTHAHVDHIYALPSLIHALWLRAEFTTRSLDVIASRETISVARSLISCFSLDQRKQPVQINWIEVSGDGHTGATEHAVTWHRVTHGGPGSLGFGIGSFFFSGDAIVDGNTYSQMRRYDSFVLDCGGKMTGNSGHAGLRDWAKFFVGREVSSNAYLTHSGFSSVAEESSAISELEWGVATVRFLEDGDRIVEMGKL